MNKFDLIKYIVVDLDDTLLTKDKKISSKTIRVLKKAKKNGYQLVFNTSRSKQNSEKYFEEVHADFGIFSGGCHIVDSEGKDLYSKTIPAKEVEDIINQLKEVCPKLSVQTKTTFYASDKEYKGQNAIYYDFDKPFHKPAYKILCLSDNHKLIEEIANKNNLEFQNYLGRGWHRLSIKGANKWNGLLKFLEIVKGTPEECMSFGDDFGDLDMILNSGVGVAMKNSQKEVLDAALYATESNEEDGVASYIEHTLLNKEKRKAIKRTNKKIKKAFKHTKRKAKKEKK